MRFALSGVRDEVVLANVQPAGEGDLPVDREDLAVIAQVHAERRRHEARRQEPRDAHAAALEHRVRAAARSTAHRRRRSRRARPHRAPTASPSAAANSWPTGPESKMYVDRNTRLCAARIAASIAGKARSPLCSTSTALPATSGSSVTARPSCASGSRPARRAGRMARRARPLRLIEQQLLRARRGRG